jgi:exonuclease III
MRLITWNVARRVEALAAQAAAVGQSMPDVVALQEVTARTMPLWTAACSDLGLGHVACTLRDADPARVPAGPRRTGVLIAARTPLEPLDGALPVPWPESALGVRTAGVEVHCVHVPNAANGEIKPLTLAAVRAGLAARSGPRVLCGDLNTPRREAPDGTVWSFARDGRGRLRPERAGFWDESELGVVPGLRELGFADAFRAVSGYGSREPSWTFRRIAGHGGGWRLDHIFCSAELEPVRCAYHHEWRDAGLSDHSALEAVLEPAPSDAPVA